jgi:hypothetical protein
MAAQATRVAVVREAIEVDFQPTPNYAALTTARVRWILLRRSLPEMREGWPE